MTLHIPERLVKEIESRDLDIVDLIISTLYGSSIPGSLLSPVSS